MEGLPDGADDSDGADDKDGADDVEGAADFADFVDLLAFAPVAVYSGSANFVTGCRILCLLLLLLSFLMNCFLFNFRETQRRRFIITRCK